MNCVPRPKRPLPQPTLDLQTDSTAPQVRPDPAPDLLTPVLTPVLSTAAAVAAVTLGAEDAWIGSEFAWLRTLPPRTKARAGAQIVELVLRGTGYRVVPRTDPGHDRVVGVVPVVIKFSTLWAQGTYVFQKLRQGTWEHAVLLGISPRGAHAWLVPSRTIAANVTPGNWLTVDPSEPPDWLAPLGGSLDEFATMLSPVFGAPVAPHGPASVEITRPG